MRTVEYHWQHMLDWMGFLVSTRVAPVLSRIRNIRHRKGPPNFVELDGVELRGVELDGVELRGAELDGVELRVSNGGGGDDFSGMKGVL